MTCFCDVARKWVVHAEFGTDAPALSAGAAGIEVDGIEGGVGFYGFFGSGFGVWAGGTENGGHETRVVVLSGILRGTRRLPGRAWLWDVGGCDYRGGGCREGNGGEVFDFRIGVRELFDASVRHNWDVYRRM